jgi:hypothetical protein
MYPIYVPYNLKVRDEVSIYDFDADYRLRLNERFGSDHWPLLATVPLP